jgi:hypothetical protein
MKKIIQREFDITLTEEDLDLVCEGGVLVEVLLGAIEDEAVGCGEGGLFGVEVLVEARVGGVGGVGGGGFGGR